MRVLRRRSRPRPKRRSRRETQKRRSRRSWPKRRSLPILPKTPLSRTETGPVDADLAEDTLEPTETGPVDADLADEDVGPADDTDDGDVSDDVDDFDVLTNRAEAVSVAVAVDGEPVPSTVLAQVRATWPEPVAPLLGDVIDRTDGLDAAALVSTLPGLWAALSDAVDRVGVGCLGRESVRWAAGTWQLALVAHGFPGGAEGDPCSVDAAWRHDRYVLACALAEAAVGRWPVSQQDLAALVDHAAGTVPAGLDAVVHLLLSGAGRAGDVAELRTLSDVLARTPTDRMRLRCFRETMVGSAKARGRMEDNEDLAGFAATEHGDVRLALLDGITGAGDGSGYGTKRRGRRCARRAAVGDKVGPIRSSSSPSPTTMCGNGFRTGAPRPSWPSCPRKGRGSCRPRATRPRGCSVRTIRRHPGGTGCGASPRCTRSSPIAIAATRRPAVAGRFSSSTSAWCTSPLRCVSRSRPATCWCSSATARPCRATATRGSVMPSPGWRRGA